MRFRPSVLGFAVLAICAIGAAPKPAASPVHETAEAVLVEVPVRVLDRSGHPIRGLQMRDFELFDDGKKQEILALDTIDLASKGTAPGEPAPISPAARRHFLILFDFSFAQPRAILAAQRAAKEFVLNGVADTDLVAVGTYSIEQGMRLLVTFSSDRVQVARAIETMGLVSVEHDVKDPLAFAFDVAKVKLTSSSIGLKESSAAAITETLQTMLQVSRARADDYARIRVRRLAESLQELASVLDSVGGRKDIIYLSEGFESRLVTGAKDTEQEREWIISGEQWKVDGEKRFGNASLKEDLRLTGELFHRSDCVLHAVDIAGLRLDPDTASVDSNSAENSLFELASPTGGEVLRNSNEFHEHFRRLLATTSLVYVLSFKPRRTGEPSRFHTLRVKCRASGSHVVARSGYYERPSFRVLSPLERSLLAADVIANEIPVTQIPTRLLASPLPNGTEPARVPVLIEVSGPELLIDETGNEATAEIYLYAHDLQNHLRDFLTQAVHVDLGVNRERLESGGLRYVGQLTLLPGEYRVRALVRNAETGRMGLAAETIRVPDFAIKSPYVAPPLFLASASDGIFVRGHSGAAAGVGGKGAGPSEFAVPGLSPLVVPEVREGRATQVSVVGYNFGYPQDLKIGAQVLSEEGRPLQDGAIRVVGQSAAEPDGKQVLVVSFTPKELSPGLYALRVFLQDPATGKAGYASSAFRVR